MFLNTVLMLIKEDGEGRGSLRGEGGGSLPSLQLEEKGCEQTSGSDTGLRIRGVRNRLSWRDDRDEAAGGSCQSWQRRYRREAASPETAGPGPFACLCPGHPRRERLHF